MNDRKPIPLPFTDHPARIDFTAAITRLAVIRECDPGPTPPHPLACHPAEDAAMSLARLRDLANGDPQAMRDFDEISEMIFAAVSDASDRQQPAEPTPAASDRPGGAEEGAG